MNDTTKDKDREKGDEVLRRLLKTPPDHKTGKGGPEAPAKTESKNGLRPKRD